MNVLIDSILQSQYPVNLDISTPFSLNDNNSKELTIIYSDVDYDIHLLPFVELNDKKYVLSEVYFSYEKFPIFSKALIILARAVELDSNKINYVPNYMNDFNEVFTEFFQNLNNVSIASGLTFKIKHDDFEGNENNTLQIKTYPYGISVLVNDINGVRFRTKTGGGKSFRVRNALTLLCYLIENHKI